MLPMTDTNQENALLLRNTMKTVFPDLQVIYNFRPKWMRSDRIAVYFPQPNVGVEFSYDGSDPSLGRKWTSCKEHGTALYILIAADIEQNKFDGLRRLINTRTKQKPKATKEPRR